MKTNFFLQMREKNNISSALFYNKFLKHMCNITHLKLNRTHTNISEQIRNITSFSIPFIFVHACTHTDKIFVSAREREEEELEKAKKNYFLCADTVKKCTNTDTRAHIMQY